MGDWPSFLEGKWGFKHEVDKEMAKKLDPAMKPVTEEINSEGILDVITFKKDGTFVLRKSDFGYKIGGHWQANDKALTLNFETYDDKPIKDMEEEAHKDAEHGGTVGIGKDEAFERVRNDLNTMTQWTLSPDGKKLIVPATDPMNMPLGPNALVRVVFEDE